MFKDNVNKKPGIDAAVAVRLRVASSCTARNAAYKRTCIKHVEDREARKTTENNAIASTTLKRTEINGEREKERETGCTAAPSSR